MILVYFKCYPTKVTERMKDKRDDLIDDYLSLSLYAELSNTYEFNLIVVQSNQVQDEVTWRSFVFISIYKSSE